MTFLFSERYGLDRDRSILQIESIDEPLRNSLWNWLLRVYEVYFLRGSRDSSEIIWNRLWIPIVVEVLKLQRDSVPTHQGSRYTARMLFNDAEYHVVFSIIEFVLNNLSQKTQEIANLNVILEREASGYRVNSEGELTPVTNDQELAAINETIGHLNSNSKLEHVNEHFHKGIQLFRMRPKADYKNSVKECVLALEAIGKVVTKNPKNVFSDALKHEAFRALHPSLREALTKLYGFASDKGGVRHANKPGVESEVSFEEAKMILVITSALINYLTPTLLAVE